MKMKRVDNLETGQNLSRTRAGTIEKKIGGRRPFFEKNSKTFFTVLFENQRFDFSKKAIFKIKK